MKMKCKKWKITDFDCNVFYLQTTI